MKEKHLDKIIYQDVHIATVIRAKYSVSKEKSYDFISVQSDPLQVGLISKKKGEIAKPHEHVCKQITITTIQEVIFVQSGKIRFSFYDTKTKKAHSHVELKTGDVIYLKAGGHSVEYLEDSVLLEIKQGPYDEQVNWKKYY